VLDARSERRGMQVEPHPSRAVPAGENPRAGPWTDDPEAGPGARIEASGLVGFVEIVRGGVILAGDQVDVGSAAVGSSGGL